MALLVVQVLLDHIFPVLEAVADAKVAQARILLVQEVLPEEQGEQMEGDICMHYMDYSYILQEVIVFSVTVMRILG